MDESAAGVERLRRVGLFAGIAVSVALLGAFIFLLVTGKPDLSRVVPWRWTALATVAAMAMYQYVSLQVNKARSLHRVPLPEMTGPPHFNRVVRVHLNTLENLTVFVVLLWLFAVLWGDAWGGVFGGTWVVGRFLYAWGYYRAVPLRVCGFGISSSVVTLLLLGCVVGLAGSIA